MILKGTKEEDKASLHSCHENLFTGKKRIWIDEERRGVKKNGGVGSGMEGASQPVSQSLPPRLPRSKRLSGKANPRHSRRTRTCDENEYENKWDTRVTAIQQNQSVEGR